MSKLIQISAEQMRIAAAGVVPLPIEQSAVWDNYDYECGRKPWRRLAWVDDTGRYIAVMALTEYSLRGVPYLWAKNGPVWLRSPSPEREQELRKALSLYVRCADKRFVFVRLHCWWNAPDLAQPLQIITYDRTIVVDTAGGDAEKMLESFTKDGRRSVRKALKKMSEGNASVVELTGLNRRNFDEVYAILQETAQRDGFSTHDADVYWKMLNALGPKHARLFAVVQEDRILCWDLVLINDNHCVAYYGASSLAAREVAGPDALDFEVARRLGAEGIKSFDLMGIDSPRVPSLYSIGIYKRRFALSYTDKAGAFDMALHGTAYRLLTLALTAKRNLRRVLSRKR